ncbi:MAG: HypC/HybG/HupF family hydrogenase formation chaperone [Chitinispirillaceae bacterium]|jgi:hydrogenase expression/formation protein HypC|nr:HypC/HybG/HupF family hydrogenase formation chaperone [Chitinispirillaceae bacterium]
MCLAIPVKITRITGHMAEASVEGTTITADLSVLPDARVGDYVMVHAGIAIQKYDEQEALSTLALFRELYGTLENNEK